MQFYDITPYPKPRMTQRDKWQQPPRPRVAKYRAFCDLVKIHNVELPEAGAHIVFIMPLPQSMPEKHKQQLDGTPHRKQPDLSNLVKALEDACYGQDSVIWDYRATKKWGRTGAIMIGRIGNGSPPTTHTSD